VNTTSDRFATLPDDETLAGTVDALKQRGFSVEVVDDLDAARETVLARIPEGSSAMTNPSVTLESTGIAEAVNEGERYGSPRAKVLALDRATQMQEIKTIMALPDFALGSVHAITHEGTLVIASALGSQLAAYTWGAGKVIFVAGTQKLVPDLDTARERIYQRCFELEDARTLKAYGKNTYIGKILEIHQDDPDRIHIVLIRAVVGF
jgi:acyl-CoA hydrolase